MTPRSTVYILHKPYTIPDIAVKSLPVTLHVKTTSHGSDGTLCEDGDEGGKGWFSLATMQLLSMNSPTPASRTRSVHQDAPIAEQPGFSHESSKWRREQRKGRKVKTSGETKPKTSSCDLLDTHNCSPPHVVLSQEIPHPRHAISKISLLVGKAR